jgi:GNAT superfamily N-acetyltransferase
MTRIQAIPDPREAVRVLHQIRSRVYADCSAWHEPPSFLDHERFDARTGFWKKHQRHTLVARDPQGVALATATFFWNRTEPAAGKFGAFECVEDETVGQALLAAGEKRLREAGCTSLAGPVYFSMHDEVGCLTRGFEHTASIMMAYNPPHYPRFFEAAGLTECRAFQTYLYDLNVSLDIVTRTPADGDGYRIRSFDKSRLEEESNSLLEIYNAAFAPVWGFSPLSSRGCRAMIDQFLLIGDPVLIRIAEFEERVIGFLLCLPDINEYFHSVRGWPDWLKKFLLIQAIVRKKIRSCRVVTLAIHPDFQGKGISKRLVTSIAAEGKKAGYGNADCSYVDDGNAPMRGLMDGYNFTGGKRFALYEKSLIPGS